MASYYTPYFPNSYDLNYIRQINLVKDYFSIVYIFSNIMVENFIYWLYIIILFQKQESFKNLNKN